jgi:hypothetical protein
MNTRAETSVISSFTDTQAYDSLLRQSKEQLAQRILVQRDLIRDLRSLQTDTKELDTLKVELDNSKAEIDHAHAQILWLEELLEDCRDRNRRLVEGEAVEWEVMA